MTLSVSTYESEASLGDYIALLKPRVMSLVVFSGFTGIVMAPAVMHPVLAAVAVLCIAMASGASGAINMWCERVLDGKMLRTKTARCRKAAFRPSMRWNSAACCWRLRCS